MPTDEVLREFLAESRENLDLLDRDLLALERGHASKEAVAGIFRTIHTIKGTCCFFDFKRLTALTHSGESLLARLRDGKLAVTPEISAALLLLVDEVRQIVAAIEATGSEPTDDRAPLIARLDALRLGEVSAPAPPTTAAPAFAEVVSPFADGTIRVDVGLLDRLMNLVGELVLARNQILQYTAHQKDPAFQSTTQRLNLITTELQEGVMKTRMQPISTIWSKYPRIVRDLALATHKQVDLELQGQETELDKSIIEAIRDPLTHILRNAVDHGLETPAVRTRAGKPVRGTISMRAFHAGGQVNIEIADDGAGIDPERIRNKAVERGLVNRELASRLSEKEVLDYVFQPGFSTAPSVTDLSGRGVGMDVVRTNVERISGTVDLHTRLGRGTTLRIRIPLTLAIIPTLLVSCGGDRFAIPQVNLLELVREEMVRIPPLVRGPDGKSALLTRRACQTCDPRSVVEYIHGVPVYRLRGTLLPLVFLHEQLQIEPKPEPVDADNLFIVVVQADDRPFGLVVDSIHDTEEIVVKPLGKLLRGIPVYAGATILGDGRVALILDILGLAHEAHAIADLRERTPGDRADKPAEPTVPKQTLLLVDVGQRRMAIPLSAVARLEEIPPESIELAAGREVVQYRKTLLPLIRLRESFPNRHAVPRENGLLQVVVWSGEGRFAGLVVDRIVDIVECEVDLLDRGPHPGLAGTAVIHSRVTDLIDIAEVIRLSSPGGRV